MENLENAISIVSLADESVSIFGRRRVGVDSRLTAQLGGVEAVTALLRGVVGAEPGARVNYMPGHTEGRDVWIVALTPTVAAQVAKRSNSGVAGVLRRAIERAAA